MANPIADRIRTLSNNTIDFANAGTEVIIKAHASALLSLEDSADSFSELAGEDAGQIDIGSAAVDFAELLGDTVGLSDENQAKAEGIIRGLLKTGTAEQIEAGVSVFKDTLFYLLTAKAMNKYIDDLLATDPGAEPPAPEMPKPSRRK